MRDQELIDVTERLLNIEENWLRTNKACLYWGGVELNGNRVPLYP